MTTLDSATWRKSSRSGGASQNCVEVAQVADATGIRDSKDQGGPILAVGHDAWASFVSGLKAGNFDLS